MGKKLVALLAVFSVSLSIFFPANSFAVNEIIVNGWAITGNMGESNPWGNDRIQVGNYNYLFEIKPKRFVGRTCVEFPISPTLQNPCSVSDFISKANKGDTGVGAFTYLPVCQLSGTTSCFNGFTVKSEKTVTSSSAIFDKYQTEYVEQKELVDGGVPGLGSASLWHINPALTVHGQGKVVAMPLSYQFPTNPTKSKQKISPNYGKWLTGNFSLEIVPYYAAKFSELPLFVPDKNANKIPSEFDSLKVVDGHVCPRYALWSDSEYCYLRDSFIADAIISANTVLPKYVTSIYGGRVSEPKFDYSIIGDYKHIEVSGAPINVPAVILTDWLKASTLQALNGSSFVLNGSSHLKLESLRKLVGDKFGYTVQRWKVASAPPLSVTPGAPVSVKARVRECKDNFNSQNTSLESFVTSNAFMGQSSPPAFDGKKMSYQLGGLHYNADGSVFEGDYQVVLNAKLARCVYGLSGALRASISIVDNSGSVQKVLTQSFKENNGLLYLRVSGFSFSEPTISFSLTSD